MTDHETRTLIRILQAGFSHDKSIIYDALTAGYGFDGEADEIPFERYISMAANMPGDRPAILDNTDALEKLLRKVDAAFAKNCDSATQSERFGETIGRAIHQCSRAAVTANPAEHLISLETATAIGMGTAAQAAKKMGLVNAEPFKKILIFFGFPVKVDFTANEITEAAFSLLPPGLTHIDILYPTAPGQCTSSSFTCSEFKSFLCFGLETGKGPIHV